MKTRTTEQTIPGY